MHHYQNLIGQLLIAISIIIFSFSIITAAETIASSIDNAAANIRSGLIVSSTQS